MFDQLVVSSSKVNKTNKSWTVALSTTVQLVIVGIMILVPLIYTEALPKGMFSEFLVAPPPPPPPPPPVQPVKVVRPKIIQPQRMVAPTVIPKKIEMIKEAAPDVGMSDQSFGVAGGTGPLGGTSTLLAPPPPKPAAPTRVRVGGNVQEAMLKQKVTPNYPQIAKAARVQGTIVLHAIIAKDGSIQELQYISGPPLLMKEAMDAVRQWRYQPTMLNGEPVEVDTTISVVFSLGG